MKATRELKSMGLSGDTSVKHKQNLEVIEIIAEERIAWSDWLDSVRERSANNTKIKNLLPYRVDQNIKEKAEKAFNKILKDYFQSWSVHGFQIFDKKYKWNTVEHPFRELQERYLRVKLDIRHGGSSLENWAAIGIALAHRETNLEQIINPAARKETRGRKSKSVSIDYERAVWKYSVDQHIHDKLKDAESDWVEIKFYSVSELIDALLFGLENPNMHSHIHILTALEAKLKLGGKSRDSLLVGFNRGEKQREIMWAE